MSDQSINQNHADILACIARAAKLANRDACEIELIAVSKVQPDERIQAMLETGQNVFGENRVQEAKARWGERFARARANIELRLIGPLQSNKTIDACQFFDVIETLDREKLARAMVRFADKSGYLPKLLVQVNTGAEPQKAGILPENIDNFIKLLRGTYDIKPTGLMCIPPAFDGFIGQAPGPHFALLKKLAQRNGLKELSMGMSSDYETAIEFGATHVRVGSALFGERIGARD